MHVAVAIVLALLAFVLAMACTTVVTIGSLELTMDERPAAEEHKTEIHRVDIVLPWSKDTPSHAVATLRQHLPWCDLVHILVSSDDIILPDEVTKDKRVRVTTHKQCGQDAPTHNPRVVDTLVHRVPGLSHWFVHADAEHLPQGRVELSVLFTPCRRPLWQVRDGGLPAMLYDTLGVVDRRTSTAKALRETLERHVWNMVEWAATSLRPTTIRLEQESLTRAKQCGTFPFSHEVSPKNLDFTLFTLNLMTRLADFRPDVFLVCE